MKRSHSSNLTSYVKSLEQKEASTLKKSRQQEIIKFRAEINKLESKRIQRINETKSLFIVKFNNIDNPLAKLKVRETVPKLTKSEMQRET